MSTWCLPRCPLNKLVLDKQKPLYYVYSSTKILSVAGTLAYCRLGQLGLRLSLPQFILQYKMVQIKIFISSRTNIFPSTKIFTKLAERGMFELMVLNLKVSMTTEQNEYEWIRLGCIWTVFSIKQRKLFTA